MRIESLLSHLEQRADFLDWVSSLKNNYDGYLVKRCRVGDLPHKLFQVETIYIPKWKRENIKDDILTKSWICIL